MDYHYMRQPKCEEKDLVSSSSNDNTDAVNLDQNDLRKALAKMIIIDNLPFSTVDREGFRHFCQEMQPMFLIPSRYIVARDCLAIFVEEKLKLKKMLKSERVCLATETWSSTQNLNYMCLTAHWIDFDWKLHKKILSFSLVPNQKGMTTGRIVENCLLDWGIDKIFTVTVDNTISSDSAICHLKRRTKGWNSTILHHKYMHLKCAADILDLIVKEGLEDFSNLIAKIRNAVRYVRSSLARLQIFKKCVEKERIESKSLPFLDVEYRWDSTYKMLETAVMFEKAFARLEVENPSYLLHFSGGEEVEILESRSMTEEGNKNLGPPTSEDWATARCFIKFLKLVYSMTLQLSGSLSVTSNRFFHELVAVQTKLVHLSKSRDVIMSSMMDNMKAKFNGYWGNVDSRNFLLYVAIVLDPRYKLKYLNFCFSKIYESNSLLAKEMTEMVELTLNCLYDHYVEHNSGQIVGNGQSCSSQASDCMDIDENEDPSELLKSQYAKYLEEEQTADKRSDVARYLAGGCDKVSDDFDILEWWKSNSPKYPILSQLARDLLAIPASKVVPSFSTHCHVLDSFRSSLPPNMLQALVCAQNWLRSNPIPLDLWEAADEVKKYEEIEDDFSEASSTIRTEADALNY